MATDCACFSLESEAYDHVAAAMGECMFEPRERASFYVGLLSIACWIACQAPQVVRNWQTGSTAGLSWGLLAQWILGDSVNTIGVFLTHQLVFQRAASLMFVAFDAALLSQKIAYDWVWRKPESTEQQHLRHSHRRVPSAETIVEAKPPAAATTATTPLRSRTRSRSRSRSAESAALSPFLGVACAVAVALIAVSTVETHAAALEMDLEWPFRTRAPRPRPPPPVELTTLHMIRNCEPHVEVSSKARFVGNLCGWFATIMYLGSRVPQIMLIRSLGSVQDMSLMMFVAAVAGNATYATAILLKSTTTDALVKQLPWLAGSLGVLGMDVYIVSRFFVLPSSSSSSSSSLDGSGLDEQEDRVDDAETIVVVS